LKAEPKFGYEFSHWSKGNTNQEDKLMPIKDTVISASFIRKGNSVYRNQVYINEVGYKDSLLSSYLELYNASDSDVNISNWIFINNKLKTIIKENTTIKSNSYFTLFKDSTEDNNKITNSQFGLFKIKKRNKIELFSAEEEFIDSVYLSEALLSNSNKIELVNTILENNWVSTELSSINKLNIKQEESKRNNYIILICFFSILSLIIFTALFFFFKNKK
jgi:hypothetical protein